MVEMNAIGDPRWKDMHPINIDEIRDNIGNFPLAYIWIEPCLNAGGKILWSFTDSEHPVVEGKPFFTDHFLGVSQKYYDENKDKLDEIFLYITSHVRNEFFTLKEELLTLDMIKAVSKNPFIKKIYLGGYSEVHELTVEEYEILKNSSIETIECKKVVPELKDVFGGKIACNDRRQLIQFYNYEDIQKKESFLFENPLSDEEIENLKYVQAGIEIKFDKYNDYENMFKVIDRLESLGKKCNYFITVQSKGNFDYKNEFNAFILSHPNYLDIDRIKIGVGILEEYPLVDYVKYEKRLIELVKPAMGLSPFEKYLYAYNVTKKFKEYKENEDEKEESRNLYQLLDGDYMVCVGYATMLHDLLTKLGISNSFYSVTVDTGFDKMPDDALVIPDDIEVTNEGHARLRVNIVDPKYDIDGIYFADPTWDNEMDTDVYNFAAMTPSEYNGMYRYNFLYFYNVDEMLFASSLDEFYQKANLWIDKKTKNEPFEKKFMLENLDKFKTAAKELVALAEPYAPERIAFIKMVYTNIFRMKIPASNMEWFVKRMEEVVSGIDDPAVKSKYNELVDRKRSIDYNKKSISGLYAKNVVHFMREILDEIKQLDPEKYKLLEEKYGNELKAYSFVPDDKFTQDFMYDVGDYIVRKTNTEIRGDQFKDAIREVYKVTKPELSPEELEKELDEVMAINIRRQRLAFPVRYRVNDDGTRVPVLNEINKFELGLNSEELKVSQ